MQLALSEQPAEQTLWPVGLPGVVSSTQRLVVVQSESAVHTWLYEHTPEVEQVPSLATSVVAKVPLVVQLVVETASLEQGWQVRTWVVVLPTVTALLAQRLDWRQSELVVQVEVYVHRPEVAVQVPIWSSVRGGRAPDEQRLVVASHMVHVPLMQRLEALAEPAVPNMQSELYVQVATQVKGETVAVAAVHDPEAPQSVPVAQVDTKSQTPAVVVPQVPT